jgi:hypothetical protein
MVQRAGWLKANGATVNRADYPRLWAYAVANSLTTNDVTNNPGLFGTGDGSTTFTLPNFEDYFIRYSYTRGVGSKQDSQMAEHTHGCGNQSANHHHQYTLYSQQVSVYQGSGTKQDYLWAGTKNANTGDQSASHKHIIGNTGSGSNTYPDNIAMQMYIKY